MILGLIPARGGSKGVKRKNLKPLLGKPLIQWTIEAAQNSQLLDHFVVSTEDPEIAKFSRSLGAVTLHRPMELAGDNATTASVMRHAALALPDADTLVLLQPTSPIRVDHLIDRCIAEYEIIRKVLPCQTLATGFISYQFPYGSVGNVPRQEMQGYFYDDGNVYVHDIEHVKDGAWWGKHRYEHVTDPWYNIELDTECDFAAAEGIMRWLGM